MSLEELKDLKYQVLSIALEPPWCENVEMLKKWVEGFEECQSNVIGLIEGKIKNVDVQR